MGKQIEIGSGFKVLCDVVGVRLARTPAAPVVPRTATGTSTRATLRKVNSAKVEISAIRGLYAPTATGKPGLVRAEPRPGYLSQDGLGRVYLNSDLALKWTKNTQFIELTAKVAIVSGSFPADGKLKWTLRDADDPTNDDPGFHPQWGRYVDAKDYDATGKHQGASGADNEGKPAKNPPWQQVGAFKLSGATATECVTEIAGGVSKVFFHCPDVAGDNFSIAVAIETKEKIDRLGHETGLITMWHRIQVDNIRMQTGTSLPVDELPIHFEPCCVQMDCVPERVVADKQFMSPTRERLSAESSKYVNSVFTPRPGWFCLIAALEPHPLPAAKGAVLFSGTTKLGKGGTGAAMREFIDIPGTHADADFAEITLGSEKIGFRVESTAPFTAAGKDMTRCWLEPHDAQPDFTAGDGSIAHAYTVTYDYSPRFRILGSAVTPGGYKMPDDVQVEVKGPGAFYTAGISPSVQAGGKPYFAGRTIVFTHHGGYYDAAAKKPKPDVKDRLLVTIVHELVHAFGMPHKCGYFDFRAPRAKTCCMNYRPNWMLDDARELVPGTNEKNGKDVCGRHLKEVRRVHLEDNKGLNWK